MTNYVVKHFSFVNNGILIDTQKLTFAQSSKYIIWYELMNSLRNNDFVIFPCTRMPSSKQKSKNDEIMHHGLLLSHRLCGVKYLFDAFILITFSSLHFFKFHPNEIYANAIQLRQLEISFQVITLLIPIRQLDVKLLFYFQYLR